MSINHDNKMAKYHFPFPRLLLVWARSFTMLFFLTVCAVVLYVGQFEDANAYIGIVKLEAVNEVGYWALLLIWLFVLVLLLPVQVRKPSDIFLCLYLLGTCLWPASYWPATGFIDAPSAVLLAVLLLLPAVLVRGVCSLASKLPWYPASGSTGLPIKWLIPTLIIFLLLATALGYRVAGAEASFDFEEGFIRRLAGRDSFADNVIAAYFMQMSTNGVAPFLAFIGAYRRSRLCLVVAFGFAVFSFWLLATKASFLNIFVLALLGELVRNDKFRNFNKWIFRGLAAILLLAVIELLMLDFSILADFGIRRVILVSSTIQAYFIDSMSQQGWLQILFDGISTRGYSSPEFYVGANYMGNELTNANTNAYLHQAALGGAPGYFGVVGLTVVLLLVLDIMLLHGHRVEGFALSALLGVLLTEQALMTALFSSGVGLCLLLALAFSRNQRPLVQPDTFGAKRTKF